MSTIKVNSIEPANAGSEDYFLARAWVNFNGTGTVAIRADGGVSSITDSGTGDYTVNFTAAMTDINHASSVATNSLDNGYTVTFGTLGIYNNNSTNPATTTSIRIRNGGSGGIATNADGAFINVATLR